MALGNGLFKKLESELAHDFVLLFSLIKCFKIGGGLAVGSRQKMNYKNITLTYLVE